MKTKIVLFSFLFFSLNLFSQTPESFITKFFKSHPSVNFESIDSFSDKEQKNKVQYIEIRKGTFGFGLMKSMVSMSYGGKFMKNVTVIGLAEFKDVDVATTNQLISDLNTMMKDSDFQLAKVNEEDQEYIYINFLDEDVISDLLLISEDEKIIVYLSGKFTLSSLESILE